MARLFWLPDSGQHQWLYYRGDLLWLKAVAVQKVEAASLLLHIPVLAVTGQAVRGINPVEGAGTRPRLEVLARVLEAKNNWR
ncbi:hypothetical protein [Endozoicomonas sp.]|uniref:hypothetical protein n=1 Tax=Endozoicomonas sp. TaxID=1892382 RepID=UPI00383A4112